MNIQIDDLILDNVRLINKDKEVLLITETADLSLLLNKIIGSVKIYQLDNDNNILYSIECDFDQPRLVEYKKYTTMYCPKVIKEEPTIQQQITDLELALCEIYESLGV